MPKKKTIKYKPKSFESEISFTPTNKKGKKNDVSSNIYYSMIISNAWKLLTGKQKELYLVCKMQYYGETLNADLLKTFEEKENDINVDISLRFTMNKSKWCKVYGLYNENCQRYFYNDIKKLVELGFIKIIEQGKNTRTKNIYEFSDKWKEYGI